jgi:hypothetical protein
MGVAWFLLAGDELDKSAAAAAAALLLRKHVATGRTRTARTIMALVAFFIFDQEQVPLAVFYFMQVYVL